MTTQHTPGPWRYDYEPGYCGEIIASNGQTICTFADEPLPSNARLIAAAPDLLDALQAIEKYMRADFDDMPMSGKARAAIAKATIAEVSQ